ncbi:MAG: hypothetical protein JRI23_20445 [Deltaproteobacteria bacterium]|jgi:hypothetical protein|nr:hypothetical protein [Deltaproteobacteria bacterium]MBW2534257.1 hypothetical protein [Deltaproteobacteria bacterium]
MRLGFERTKKGMPGREESDDEPEDEAAEDQAPATSAKLAPTNPQLPAFLDDQSEDVPADGARRPRKVAPTDPQMPAFALEGAQEPKDGSEERSPSSSGEADVDEDEDAPKSDGRRAQDSVPPSADAEPSPESAPRRSGGRTLLLLLLVLIAAAAGGWWWTQHRDRGAAAPSETSSPPNRAP